MSNSSYVPPVAPVSCLVSHQQVVLTGSQSVTLSSATWTDFSDGTTTMSITFTPTSATNKLEITGCLNTCRNLTSMYMRVLQDGAVLLQGDAASNRIRCTTQLNSITQPGIQGNTFSFMVLAGTTSSTTIKVQWYQTTGALGGVNRATTDTDDSNHFRTVSVMDIKEYSA